MTSGISSDQKKQLYALLEANKSWRAVKVAYFIATVSLALVLLLNIGRHSYDSSFGFGILAILLIYPGYLLTRMLFMYISGVELQNNIDKPSTNKALLSSPLESLAGEQAKKVRHLENIALMLDRACKGGEVLDENVEKAQDILNLINEKYQDDNDILGSKAYLIYEVQGLIHWVKGEKKDAYDLMRSARDAKGDSNLFTKSANELLVNAQSNQSKNINPLWIFLLGVVFLFIGNSLGGVIGASIGLAGDIFLLTGVITGVINLVKK